MSGHAYILIYKRNNFADNLFSEKNPNHIYNIHSDTVTITVAYLGFHKGEGQIFAGH